jgi:hypothetical protein
MRSAVACVFLFAGLLVGCAPPVVEVISTSGDVIPLGQAEVLVVVRDLDAQRVTLLVDGEPAAFDVETLRVTPSCSECADFLLRFPAVEVAAGEHELGARVADLGDREIGRGFVGVTFDAAPAVRRIEPSSIADLEGVGTIEARYGIIAREPVNVTLALRTTVVASLSRASCRTECELTGTVDTATPRPGTYQLMATATTSAGEKHLAEDIKIKDVVRVRGMTFTNLGGVDLGLSTPDVEVYVYDATDERILGCVGPGAFSSIKQTGVAYDLNVDISATASSLSLFEVLADLPEDHLIRFEVWEDDDAMECPAPPDPDRPDANADDLLGVSPALTLAAWETQAPLAFGGLSEFDIAIGRPLSR